MEWKGTGGGDGKARWEAGWVAGSLSGWEGGRRGSGDECVGGFLYVRTGDRSGRGVVVVVMVVVWCEVV